MSDASNTALHFDGLDDRVTFGPAPSLGVTTFTLETWFRRDGPGAAATTGSGGIVAVPLVTKGMAETEGDNRDTNYFLGIDSKRRVLAADFEDNATGANHPALGVTAICDGIWYHAAATYDGTTWRLYLNGNLESQVVVGAFTPRFDSIQHAALGSALNSTGNAGGAFMGALDEVRIWNVARSAADIQSTMTMPLPSAVGLIGRWGSDEGIGTSIADSTGNGHTGTLLNGTGWEAGTPFVSTPTPPGAYGLHLKGTSTAADYVSFGAAPGLGAATFTVETWFKRDGTGVTTSTGSGGLTAAIPLLTKGRNESDGSTTDVNYFLGLTGNVLAADFEEGATGATPGLNHPITGVTTIQNNVWYHGAVTYDGTTLHLYLNGVLEGTLVVGQPPRADSIEQAALGAALNSAGVAAGFFAGTLDEARIWNYARTPPEILSGRDREIATASGLLGRWSFNECCGQAPDSSGHNQNGTLFGSSWTWVSGAPLTGTANAAPVANAGPDQIITLPASALLTGSVIDDGLGGAPVTTVWSKTSGPGTVTFGNATALSSTAAFSVAGTYILTLTANDGEFAASDAATIQVNPGTVNLAPIVNAGPDQTLTLPAPASLSGIVTDDGLPGGDPIATWSKVSGPGTVSFAQPNEWATTATVSSAGTYVLMLSANDGALTSSDTLTVIVSATTTNRAIDFGGTNSYVTFGAAPGLGAATFTIEAWFRRDGNGVTTSTGSGGATAVPLVTKGRSENDGSNVDMNYFLGIANSSNVLVADFEEGASGPSPGLNHPVSGVTAIQNNVWYHAAATYDGTKWQLFLNGVLERELTVGRPPRSDSIQHAAIGSALNSTGVASGFFNGVIDEVRIWNVARTAQQIAGGMSGEIISSPGLLGRWGLNEGSGTVISDSSGHAITGTIVSTNWSWAPGAPFNVVVNAAPDAPVLNAPANGATGVSSPATLDVSVSDRDADTMTVTFNGHQKSVVAPDFTLATLPDTQHYVDNATFPGTFTAQTNWIVANQIPLNIAFVSHLGDVTQNIDLYEIEWQRATTSMAVLDASAIPHGMSPGNHDETAAGVANFYDQYFPVSRFQGFPWYIGYLGQEADDPVNRQNKNNYELFSVGGLDFLVIHVEFDWPDYAVAWADKIIKRYPNRRVILSTHLFVNTSNARPTSAQFRSNGTSAEAVWQQIIKPNCNVFMVINGHYPGEGRRTDLNDCGQPVHQVLMDYQDRANGGDGWLRYFTFKPSENKIYAYTFSPTRNGGLGEFETDDSSQFVLDYDMQGTPFSVIATNANVASGSRTTAAWTGLTPNTDYEWYATVNDGKTTTVGPMWSFKAGTQGNAAPVATNDTYGVAEDGTVTMAAPGVLGNDTDADGNSLRALLVGGPSHGALVLNANGSFTYTPTANYNGADSFTYKANDGTADSNVATVTITVAAVNDAPVAAGDSYSATEDTALTIAAPGVLANDTDVENSALTAALVSGPTHGALVFNANGSFTYTPTANYNGADSFTYRANDGTADSNVATVTITVAAVNDAPVAAGDSYTVTQGTVLTIAAAGVLANDTDVENSVLTAVLVSGPTHGALVFNANGSFTYTPTASYNGPDSFTYKASDGTADSNVATAAIAVTAVVSAPDFMLSASPSSRSVTPGGSTSYAVTITPTNGFSGQVSLSVSGLPSGASGSFSPNPATASSTLSVTTGTSTPAGTYTLTLTGVSGTLTHTTTVLLTVAPGGVAYDNKVSSGIRFGVATVTTPAFTIGSGTNRAAMIMVAMSANGATSITASLGGVSGTVIAGTDSGTTATIRTLIFQVINPPSGSQTATVSWAGSTLNVDVGVMTVRGADQTTACTNGTFAANNSTPAAITSVTITSNAGDLTASIGTTADAWVTPFTNQTLKWGVDSSVTGGDIGPGTGTTTHTWTDPYYFQSHAVSGANFKASATP